MYFLIPRHRQPPTSCPQHILKEAHLSLLTKTTSPTSLSGRLILSLLPSKQSKTMMSTLSKLLRFWVIRLLPLANVLTLPAAYVTTGPSPNTYPYTPPISTDGLPKTPFVGCALRQTVQSDILITRYIVIAPTYKSHVPSNKPPTLWVLGFVTHSNADENYFIVSGTTYMVS